MTSLAKEPSVGGQPQQDENGGPVIDPTKNVLDLVKAESKYQDGMRDALERLLNAKAEGEAKTTKLLSEAESKRIDQLASLRLTYDARIADMLRTSVESTSSLVSTQLVQIQNTFNDRVAKLEQFRWESGGKTSVSDPAIADALGKMSASIVANKASEIETLNKLMASISALQTTDVKTEAKSAGIGMSISTIVQMITSTGTLLAIVAAIIAFSR